MDFNKLICCMVLLSSRMCFAYSEQEGDMPMELERLLDELTSLKNKLDEWFRRNNNNNVEKCGNDTENYFAIVADFLKGNHTSEHQNNSTKAGFFKSVKQKILNVFRGKNSTETSPHVRRCIASSVKLPKSKAKITKDADNFHQYLTNVINCLETNKKKVQQPSDENIGSTTDSQDEEANGSKMENFLKYMADSHHTVEETGKAGFKPPDLRRTQEIIDSAKSSMIDFNFDDETTTSTTFNPFGVNEIKKRNIFDDFMRKSQKLNSETKTNVKMKENELFNGMLKIDDDMREMGGESEVEEGHEKIIDEETLLDNDLNALSSKLDADQQLVIMNFLEQIKEKPKPFKFDVQPYLQSSLKSIMKKTLQDVENSPEVPRKYFDFELDKKKRDLKKFKFSLNDGSVPTNQIVTKFKPKLVLTPEAIEKNFQLEEIFKELHFNEHEHELEHAPEIPFYKTEKIDDDETAAIENVP